MAQQGTLMKALTKSLSGGALESIAVYGVELTDPLPTELPANTLRIDLRERLRKELRPVSRIAQELYEEGREEGEAKKAEATARAMLTDGLDIERIARYTGLSVEEVERLRKELSN